MAKNLSSNVTIHVLMLFLLISRNHGMITESPSPSPQPQPSGLLPTHGITPGSLHPQECSPRCTYRCSKTAFKKPCMFFCQKCCAKCLCVPPGTYGNKQFCPCYNNWKTKRGGPKCP
ncbi:protein GAST1-like [Coffea eugenioides]|uniref:Protein GAST1 n=1 Tax=Coffea arabica TaxID=13443 RepID=A0A6P6SXS0_COFAR|nr:protein GAST1-like [Coffea arabica]XP_027176276.1 protein GAST1-like [Coffea eugenioides]